LNRNYSILQTDQGGNAVADKLIRMAYNDLGQFTYISRYQSDTIPAGGKPVLRTAFTYDGANRVQTIAHRKIDPTSALLNDYDFSYDGMGRITEIDSNIDGVSTYSYDKTSQLTSADHAPSRPDESFSFDLNGNRRLRQRIQQQLGNLRQRRSR